MPEMPDWQRFLSADDRETIERGRWAKRVGFGARPAVILIDVQNYMVGEEDNHDLAAYPYSCATGWAAVWQTKRIVGAARAAQAPVIYTRFAIDRTVGDAGLFDAKIGAEAGENVYFEGTHGSAIVDGGGTRARRPCLHQEEAELLPRHAPPALSDRPRHRYADRHRRRHLQLRPRHGLRRLLLQLSHHRTVGCGVSTACRSATRSTCST